jgi:hypothetical protein
MAVAHYLGESADALDGGSETSAVVKDTAQDSTVTGAAKGAAVSEAARN